MSAANQLKWILKKKKELAPSSSLTFEQQELKESCEKSFHEFVKAAWHVLEGSNAFVDSWHIKLLCEELEGASEFKYNRYIWNLPPRCMKTTLLTMFAPWVWIKKPHYKFMVISGSKKLALMDNLKCRNIIESEWFKGLWGDKVKLKADSKAKETFHIEGTGSRSAFGMGTNVLGHGANFLILDDPNSSMDLRSETLREAKNEFITSSVLTRFNDSNESCLICVQQRLGIDDCSGYLLDKAKENPAWKIRRIVLPMIKE